MHEQPTSHDEGDGDLRVVELRQYTLKPGRRDELIELFERHFLESQEEHGIRVLGQFRDLNRPDHFVWLRGFTDMEARHRALEGFYDGPVWGEHKHAANDTMLDSDDVMLLKPSRPGGGVAVDARRPRPGEQSSPAGLVLAGVHLLPQPVDEELRQLFETELFGLLRDAGVRLLGIYVTESEKNSFARLPVREGENALVWVGTAPDDRLGRGQEILSSPAFREHLAPALERRSAAPVEILELAPTSRSLLCHRLEECRQHDFDFLHGRWRVHNRRLAERLAGCTEWVEFAATAECWPRLGGLANEDEYRTDYWPGFLGMTVRLFDPRAGQWSIYWADNRRGTLDPPMRGSFAGKVGFFEGPDSHQGRPVLSRFLWHRGPAPRWEQAFSADGGRTWETNWTMDFTPLG